MIRVRGSKIRECYPGAIVVASIHGNRWSKGLILTSMLSDKDLEDLFAGKEIESPYDGNEYLALIEE